MADTVQTRRVTVNNTGVTTGTVAIFKCQYCGFTVTGSSPNYLREDGPPNTGGIYACPARGGVLPHTTH